MPGSLHLDAVLTQYRAKSISIPKKKPEKRPSPAKINTKVAQEWPLTHGPDTSVPNSAEMGYMYGPYIPPSEDEATWMGGAGPSDDRWSSMPPYVLDKPDPMDLDQPSWPEALYPNDRMISSDTHMHGAPPPAPILNAPPHAYHVDRMTEPPADIRRALSPVQLERLWPAAKRQRVSTAQGTDGHMTVSVFNLPERKQVKALGGPYQAIFNYKREIMGRLESLKRCFVCLHYECFLKQVPVGHQHWGIRWCDDCLGQYTICTSPIFCSCCARSLILSSASLSRGPCSRPSKRSSTSLPSRTVSVRHAQSQVSCIR